ncbi:MAG: DNA alkylation repair protein [Planctomycetota bacterium]|nr:DNA alkylation repair protein [Planctomycetota bacterium]
MQSLAEVMQELERLGTEQTRKTFARHGAPLDQMYGVKVADLKTVLKKIKGRQDLAMELYDTGNSDAMYLAGMVANGALMSKKQLELWAKNATWYMIGEYTVPAVTCESSFATELARKWIDSKQPSLRCTGWTTWSGIVAIQSDKQLDLNELELLLSRVVSEIHKSDNRVRSAMNGFVISLGGYVLPLQKKAIAAARKIGKVEVDMGDTACKVPSAVEYIEKMIARGNAGKKRRTIKC